MDKKEKENIKKSIIKTASNIRKKLKALRSGKMKSDLLLQTTLEPVTAPLKEIATKLSGEKTIQPIKVETKEEQTQVVDTFTPKNKKRKQEYCFLPMKEEDVDGEEVEEEEQDLPDDVFESSPVEEERNVFETPKFSGSAQSVARKLMTPTAEDLTAQFGPIARKYLQLYLQTNSGIDTVYGPYKKDDEWMIGNQPFQIDGDDIIINNITYKGTPGLYELIFMKVPKKGAYRTEDLNVYKRILKQTNAHRRNHSPNQQIKGSVSYKYRNIISDMLPIPRSIPRYGTRSRAGSTPTFGTGLMQFNNLEKDFKYWYDPNVLVSRLRLLVASQQAGHTQHNNEIISIIEELIEAGYIEHG